MARVRWILGNTRRYIFRRAQPVINLTWDIVSSTKSTMKAERTSMAP